ncbi:hypothetical protein Cgig2_016088 [Carnegiea gigantea]|uniref:Uncharacterized protein n=1 Tax=Carnegiea gigantea TaxID=171969 RepID=A0A9Q1KQ06_9CARY|nr:hypothetical protein Cgig2_016088 [Carnegiea gigantea]
MSRYTPCLSKHGADTLKGMQKPYRAEMPRELSKLNRPCEKFKTMSLPLIPSRLPMHPRVRKPSGTRNKRSPLTLFTRKQKTPRREFHCHHGKDSDRDSGIPSPKGQRQEGDRGKGYYLGTIDKHPRKDDERIRHFHTTPSNILMEIKGNPMLRHPNPIDTPAKFRNKNKYCEYHEDNGHTIAECRDYAS